MGKSKLIKIAALSAALAIALAVAVFTLGNVQKASDARLALSSIASGEVVPAKVAVKTFSGQNLPGATVEQKALVSPSNGESAKAAVFTFTGSEPKEDGRIVDVFINFGDHQSRDFMLINEKMFTSLISSGSITFRVHPILGGSSFSVYAAHTVADSLAVEPESSFNLIFDLLRASHKASDLTDNKQVQALVVETAKDSGFTKVKAQSLDEGRFAAWLLAVGDLPQLQNTFAPPILVVDGNKVQPESANYNNPQEVYQAIR